MICARHSCSLHLAGVNFEEVRRTRLAHPKRVWEAAVAARMIGAVKHVSSTSWKGSIIMVIWNSFWGIVWFFFWTFAFIAYLFALFAIIADLFRDHKLNGWFKAIWIVFLIFVPFLTALVYVIARGRGMAERGARAAQRTDAAAVDALSYAPGSTSAADEIAKAKALLDTGAITPQEFQSLKARVV
jgi:hypothetical protein